MELFVRKSHQRPEKARQFFLSAQLFLRGEDIPQIHHVDAGKQQDNDKRKDPPKEHHDRIVSLDSEPGIPFHCSQCEKAGDIADPAHGQIPDKSGQDRYV